MINMINAQGNQTTINGVNQDWVVTLDGVQIYRLPAHFSVQETFLVRDIVEEMVKKAVSETKEQEQQLCLVKMNHIVSKGDAKLYALKRENERLSDILDTHMGEVT